MEIVHIRTHGDQRTDVPLWQVSGRAFFTREIDRAVLAGEVDVAVHSLKDLPTGLETGLALGAVLEREDPRDALLCRGVQRLEDLPAGARVGTSSLRRRAFLARARADLVVQELRGNVPTRIERLAQGHYEAIILAAAGLKRLGLERHITTYLPPMQFTPAVSQGAIGIVSRAGDERTGRWIARLDDFPTRMATLAERTLLQRVEGGCQVPLGALGALCGERLSLTASVCALDGSGSITVSDECPLDRDAEAMARGASELGNRLGTELLARGAMRIIEAQRDTTGAKGDTP